MKEVNTPTESLQDFIKDRYMSPEQVKANYDQACALIKKKLDDNSAMLQLSQIITDSVFKEIKDAAENNQFQIKKQKKIIEANLSFDHKKGYTINVNISKKEYEDFKKILELSKKECFRVEDLELYVNDSFIQVSTLYFHCWKYKNPLWALINIIFGSTYGLKIAEGGYFFNQLLEHISKTLSEEEISFYFYTDSYRKYDSSSDEYHSLDCFNLHYRIEFE